MSYERHLNGLYVITDDNLTEDETCFSKVEQSLLGGASVIQLRDKINDNYIVKQKANKLQHLCRKYNALFVLNDNIEVAMDIRCDGLHIGKNDYDKFKSVRRFFNGVIGVSCYGDIENAKRFEKLGANYVAFGSFFNSPTKPDSSLVPLDILSKARRELKIPVCAIGGINYQNINSVMEHNPHMVSTISDIWKSENITTKASFYTNQFKRESA